MQKILKRILFVLTLSFCLVNNLTSCKITNNEEQITITDMNGDSVTITKNPKKVACCRSAYDLLIAFGLGDNIDGVDKKILANPWTKVIYPESINHFEYEYENSYELYLSRGVDLVFSPEKRITDELNSHGINAVTVSLYGNPTFDNQLHAFSNMIKQIWPSNKVNRLVNRWDERIDNCINEISNTIKNANVETKKLFYVRGDKDKGIGYTDTKGCFVEYAYRMLGFDCMSASLDSYSNKVSAEALCEYNPDVFVMGGIYQHKHINEIKETEPYNTLDSVKNNKIYNIPMGIVQMEQLNTLSVEFFYDQANKLYPELFNYNVKDSLKNSISEYFGGTLTDAQINYMLTGYGPDGSNLY